MTLSTAPIHLERAAEITRLVVDDDVAVEKVASQFGVTPNRIYQILGQTTHRAQVMLFLLEHKDEKYTSREIAQAVNVDIKKVEFTVHRLVKRGRAKATKVQSSVAVGGGHAMWVNIQLTTQGIAEARTLLPKPKKEPKPKESVGLKKAAALGSAIGEAAIAAGKAAISEETLAISKVVPTAVVPRPEPSPTIEELKEEAQRAIRQEDLPALTKPEDLVGLPAAGELREQIIQETIAKGPRHHVLGIGDIPRFPLINKLVERSAKLTQAAKLVESAVPKDERAADYEDLVLAILSKVDDFTPLEREVIAYIELRGEEDDD